MCNIFIGSVIIYQSRSIQTLLQVNPNKEGVYIYISPICMCMMYPVCSEARCLLC